MTAIQRLEVAAVIEPDFSVWVEDPLALQLYAVYRSRWVGRYWQSRGLPVIPSLNWGDARSYEFAWCGLPRGLPVAAVECRSCGVEGRERFNAGLAAACAVVQPRQLLIYGVQLASGWMQLPRSQAVTWVEPAINRRFRQLKANAKGGR